MKREGGESKWLALLDEMAHSLGVVAEDVGERVRQVADALGVAPLPVSSRNIDIVVIDLYNAYLGGTNG